MNFVSKKWNYSRSNKKKIVKLLLATMFTNSSPNTKDFLRQRGVSDTDGKMVEENGLYHVLYSAYLPFITSREP